MELSVLFKNNVLVKSKNNFKVEENRALQVIFLEVQKNKNNIVNITQDAFEEILKSNDLKTKNGIEKLLRGLIDNHIEIKYKGDETWRILNLISDAYWNKKEQLFIIEVPTILKELLIDYKKDGYTPLDLANYSVLKSSNTQRLYELIRAWTKYNVETVVEYKVDDIKKFLNLGNSYELFSNFRRKIIEKAIHEFEANNLFEINAVEYVKRGKNIVSIRFYVIDLKPKSYDFKNTYSHDNTEIYEPINLDDTLENKDYFESTIIYELDSMLRDSNIKISPKTLKDKAKEFGTKKLIKAVEVLINKNKCEKVKAPVKYLIATLTKINDEKVELPKKLSATNFTQREYNYNLLEKQLLGWEIDDEDSK